MNCERTKVSIIMPVYNMAQYLEETISSLQRQTLNDIEILCIDDGSTDNSFSLLKRLAKDDARIRVFHFFENRSAWCARKLGIEKACGEYILFIDADDTILPETCEELYREITKAGVDILHFAAEVVNECSMPQARIARLKSFLHPHIGVLRGADVCKACFREHKYNFSLWDKMYRAAVCKQAVQNEKDAYLPRGQDKLLYWMISYTAQSYKGIKGKWYYLYHVDRGGFGKKEIDLNSFEGYCKMAEAAARAVSFLRTHGEEEKYVDMVQSYRKEDLSSCVYKWWNLLREEDKAAGFDKMLCYWGRSEVIAECAEKFFDQRASFERWVRGSTSLTYDRRKIKTILCYAERLNNGGIERAVCSLCQLWDEMGYRVILLTNEESTKEDYKLSIGSRIEHVVLENNNCLTKEDYEKRAEEWEEIVRKYGVDTVVYHPYYRPVFLWDALVIKANGASVIGYWHSTFSVGFNVKWKWKNFMNYFSPYELADALAVLSDTDCAFFRYYNGNVHTLINPVTENLQDWRRDNFVSNQDILWCGRLDSLKNPTDVIPIMKDVLLEVPDAVLHIVGKSADGKIEGSLEQKIKEEGLKSHVILEGFTADVKPWYLSVRVFLMTSELEGYCMALAESKMAGLPCVMYELPYLTLCEGNRGIIPVPQRDTKAAAKAIVRLLKDDELCGRYGREARAHIEELTQFDLKKKWREIFESVEMGYQDPVTPAEKRMMDMLIGDYTKESDRATQSRKLGKELYDIRHGYSFRIGRIVTWGPRKFRGGVKCFQQHGLVYTVKRMLEHVGVDMGTGDFGRRK